MIADLKATIARFEAPKPRPTVSTAQPINPNNAQGELIFTSVEDISVKVSPHEWQHLKGYVISVINHRLGAINRVKFTVYSAQSFDSHHRGD